MHCQQQSAARMHHCGDLAVRPAVRVPVAPLLWQLCCVCGTISPDVLWTRWHRNLDEATEAETPWVPARAEEDPMELCPACGWQHQDTDDGSGCYDGTLAEMQAQRAADLPEFGEHWSYRFDEVGR